MHKCANANPCTRTTDTFVICHGLFLNNLMPNYNVLRRELTTEIGCALIDQELFKAYGELDSGLL